MSLFEYVGIKQPLSTGENSMTERDEQGRFLLGQEGLPDAGRPKGSRQSLCDLFFADLAEFWDRERSRILFQVAAERPGGIVRAVTSLD
mgnify:CR=1 FL=1